MAESNIFDIIRRERLNICDIDTNNINKVFLKFYFIILDFTLPLK